MDLRTELIAKDQKIEALKKRIKILEAEISEFVNIQNELGKVILVSSKKSDLTGVGPINNKSQISIYIEKSSQMLNALDTLSEDYN